jgi:hypothetical protein
MYGPMIYPDRGAQPYSQPNRLLWLMESQRSETASA